jgi:hypothetical protein
MSAFDPKQTLHVIKPLPRVNAANVGLAAKKG